MKGVNAERGDESARLRCLEAARGSTKKEGAPQRSLSLLLDTKPSVHRVTLCDKGAERLQSSRRLRDVTFVTVWSTLVEHRGFQQT